MATTIALIGLHYLPYRQTFYVNITAYKETFVRRGVASIGDAATRNITILCMPTYILLKSQKHNNFESVVKRAMVFSSL